MAGTDEPKILVVEDNPSDARLIREMLRDVDLDRGPYAGQREPVIDVTESLTAGIEAIDAGTGLVLLDLELPDSKGIETVERMAAAAGDRPIVVLTGLDDEETGMEAIQRGAQDYLVKDDADPRTLRRAIRHAMERERQQRALRRRSEKLGVLTWVLRHDIRDEMAIVVGRGRSLRDHVEPSGEPYLDEVIEAGKNAIDLTEAVGEFLSALEGEGATDESVPLAPVLTEELSSARDRNAGTEYELDGEVPDVTVAGSELLGSMVGQLLDLTSDDGSTVTVSATTDGDRAVVEFATEDGSIDLPELEPAPGPAGLEGDEFAGGVGPYLVETVADLYGGEVVIEDENGPTTLRLRLPLR